MKSQKHGNSLQNIETLCNKRGVFLQYFATYCAISCNFVPLLPELAIMANIRDIALIGLALYLAKDWLINQASNRFPIKGATISLGRFSPYGVGATVNLSIENKTPAPIPVESIAGEITYQGQKIATYLNTSGFTIEPNSTTVIPISLEIPYQGASRAVIDAITSGQISTSLQISGRAKSAGIIFPFSYSLVLI